MSAAEIELPIPRTAADDPKAIEIARMWVAHGEQHVAIRVGVWKKPEAWGIVLADLAKHLASAYEQHVGLNRDATLEQIKAKFEAEMNSLTEDPTRFLM
jgi:hypothetical protein